MHVSSTAIVRLFTPLRGTLALFGLLALAVLTSGCSFHLRGFEPLPIALQDARVSQSKPGAKRLERLLIEQLREQGARVNQSYAQVQISIQGATYSRQALSKNAEGDAISYEYDYHINYEITDLFQPQRPSKQGTVRTRQTRPVLLNNPLGQEQADANIQDQLERQLIERLVFQLSQDTRHWAKPKSDAHDPTLLPSDL